MYLPHCDSKFIESSISGDFTTTNLPIFHPEHVMIVEFMIFDLDLRKVGRSLEHLYSCNIPIAHWKEIY